MSYHVDSLFYSTTPSDWQKPIDAKEKPKTEKTLEPPSESAHLHESFFDQTKEDKERDQALQEALCLKKIRQRSISHPPSVPSVNFAARLGATLSIEEEQKALKVSREIRKGHSLESETLPLQTIFTSLRQLSAVFYPQVQIPGFEKQRTPASEPRPSLQRVPLLHRDPNQTLLEEFIPIQADRRGGQDQYPDE